MSSRSIFYLVIYALMVGLMAPAVLTQRATAQEESADQEMDIVESNPQKAAELEARFLGKTRQLTFEGRRAGEGYFSRDGRQMVFQSEREEGNPFFQIYVMDFDTGDLERISPGQGKTTCAWIHPEGHQVLFASTHDDPDAVAEQNAEIKAREEGTQRRYAWDYDTYFDLYAYDRTTKKYQQLTDAKGYDAEGSWSPDGSKIVFASNRLAYSEPLSEEDKKLLEIDPSYFIDLYIMNADGSDLRRLTDTPGYDGGPFFSADGQQICWRHFSEDGAQAEIMVMNVDGSEPRQLTRFGAMSWAPYFHPSGDYLIFTTNRHGFANFELYLVSSDGKTPPVRVTHTAGFDGLPVFSPDGNQLAWTTNRTSDGQSQIFISNWNHEFAKQLVSRPSEEEDDPEAGLAAQSAIEQSSRDFTPSDIGRHVDYLCRPELGGRYTGSRGEKLATAYVAAYLESLGLEPAGPEESWYQPFEFTSGVTLGADNRLAWDDKVYTLEKDWRPVGFSRVGEVNPTEVVFAGYGISAPERNGQDEYDSFVHLDVKDKWVLVFRFMPEDIPPEQRQHLSTHSSLRYKAMQLRDMGAKGMLVVSGPNAVVRNELVPLGNDGTAAAFSLPVVSVSNDVASTWLANVDKDLAALQTKLDQGDMVMGFPTGVMLSANVDIQQEKSNGRNVLGRLQVGDEPSEQVIVVGAHIDHLGQGPSSGSLAKDDERDGVHRGADDNASGVAGMLEIAQYLSDMNKAGKLAGKRDIIFAAWSGEELGLIGSSHFIKQLQEAAGGHPHAPATLYPSIAAALNMDMIGRLRDKVVLQGVGSSTQWTSEIERRNAPVGLSITLQKDGNLPTDAAVFYRAGIPILSAFTGSHEEYHTPRDTPDTLNYEGAAQVAQFMGLVARSLAMQDDAPDYVEMSTEDDRQPRAALRAYLGTVPDYAQEDVKGVLLSSVAKGGPAAKAGVKNGDVIVELAGRKIENIYDYTYAIEALKIGQKTSIAVQRGKERLEFEITPGSRQ